ncbi:MAG: hypothetical protein ACTSYA_06565 [Candidatus Kariarchaeaceae archaeon]
MNKDKSKDKSKEMNQEKKIEIRYEKLQNQTEKERKQIQNTYEIETRHAIIMIIETFGSSNIKKIATLLKKNEATIYYHIKELVQTPELLQIDEEMTRLRKGKFYKLSSLAIKHFSDEEESEESEETLEKFDRLLAEPDEFAKRILIEMMAKHPDIGTLHHRERQKLSYNHITESIMVNNFENAEMALVAGKEPRNKKYPFGSISNVSLKAKVHTAKHLFRFLKVLTEFQAEFYKLNKMIGEEMKRDNVSEDEKINLRFNIVGGEISEFYFD